MLLDVQDLKVSFHNRNSSIQVIKGISFDIREGETLGIVGESGCGKSVTSLSIMGLLAKPAARIDSGSILFHGEDLLKKSRRAMAGIRGDKISMIFQEPMTSLNPVKTIGSQIDEVFRIHQGLGAAEQKEHTVEMLRMVGIPSPERRYRSFSHQLSGGMRQRVMIAMALACQPDLIIADEPTTALDVTIQAQILNLMRDLKKKTNASIMLITHDIGVIAEMCDRVIVMYAGSIVEKADIVTLLQTPAHPYTAGLLKSIPRIDRKVERLSVIEGVVPSPGDKIDGCMFHPRCPYASDICRQKVPASEVISEGHSVACWHALMEKEA